MFDKLKSAGKILKQEIDVYRLVIKDERTPRISRWLLASAIGYLFMPFDLIPDWIPVVGHLDDVIIIPLLVIMALKFIPETVIVECREKVNKTK